MSSRYVTRVLEMPDARERELDEAMQQVHERIASACDATGRSVEDVTLIVVTKFFPVDDLRRLIELGVQHVGESKDQEASLKIAALDDKQRSAVDVHFIGQLQSNKAGHVGGYADCVQSVDRVKIARALDRGAAKTGRVVEVLVQVDLDGSDAGRGGTRTEDVAELADRIEQLPALRLRGLMAVAPRGVDPDAAFSSLQHLAQDVQSHHPAATWISAGMSGDLEQAVAHGATHLRVGSAILGSRPPQR